MQCSPSGVLATVVLVAGLLAPAAPTTAQADPHATLDRILDVYVRDGLVYYAALKSERASLDRYVASLDDMAEAVARMGEADRQAFWINAYNALVLRTVINAYPIRGKAPGYPASSVAQIPGGFDRIKHRVAGQVLTLDEIEKTVIAGFGDARMLLALGRGTIGSGRLRSEAYRGARLEDQLAGMVKELVRRADWFKVDLTAGTMQITPLLGWREAYLVKSYASQGQMWADRSPLERAVAAMAYPEALPGDREFLARNTFRTVFSDYDWRLNDLTGGSQH
jgi:hypothetical protein